MSFNTEFKKTRNSLVVYKDLRATFYIDLINKLYFMDQTQNI